MPIGDTYFDPQTTDPPAELAAAIDAYITELIETGAPEFAAALKCDEFSYRRHKSLEDAFLVMCPSGVQYTIEDGEIVSSWFVTGSATVD